VRLAVYLFLFVFGLLGASLPAHAVIVEDKPAAVLMVEKLHTALLDAMKQGNNMSFAERKEMLAPVVQEVFDLDGMLRIAIGGGWQKLNEDERKKVTEAFAGWTIATYASKFKSWNGEQFSIIGSSNPAKIDVVVNAEIKEKSGRSNTLQYRLRQKPTEKNDGPWQVIDILLDGVVSQVALRRADFAGVLNNGGASALVQHLQALTDKLAAEG
jgi:phospholipid transport system substrate-binding protein